MQEMCLTALRSSLLPVRTLNATPLTSTDLFLELSSINHVTIRILLLTKTTTDCQQRMEYVRTPRRIWPHGRRHQDEGMEIYRHQQRLLSTSPSLHFLPLWNVLALITHSDATVLSSL